MIFSAPETVYLYNEAVAGVDFKALELFIKKNFGNVSVKTIRLKEGIVKTKGLLLDFLKTKELFEEHVSQDKNACHIILTNKLFASFGDDKRLHIRASIYSFPSLISLPGIVEGPAKPKDYYFYKDKFTKLGVWHLEEPKIKARFRNRFIDYDDKRKIEVLKGYISQVMFFYITGEPFCQDKGCRLFNSHWQEDLIFSQIKKGRFCLRHTNALKRIKKLFLKKT